MRVDVNSSRLTRRIVTFRRRIIVDQRYDNADIAKLVDDILHVHRVWKRLNSLGRLGVLVLWLDKDDGPTVGDLSFRNVRSNVLHVAVLRQHLYHRLSWFIYLSVAFK
jgi:hypothetical protein